MTLTLVAQPTRSLPALLKSTLVGLGMLMGLGQYAVAAETTANKQPTIRAMLGAKPSQPTDSTRKPLPWW